MSGKQIQKNLVLRLFWLIIIIFFSTQKISFSPLAAEEGGEAWKYSLRVCTEMLK